MARTLTLVFLLATLALPAGAEDGALRLHVLDCGTMKGMDTESFLPGVEDRPEHFDFVNRCFLVVHPKGTLLWDAGLPQGFTFRMMSWLMWLTGTDVDAGPSIVEQLAEIGMQPDDVDYLAFSHVHFDHAGQAEDFTSATWLVQKIERDWVFDSELDNDAVFVGLIEPLRESKAMELTGDHDVFGDGSVQILSSPGHTPGHQCLYLELPETGRVVLSGDLYHSLLNRELRKAPDFNTDEAQSLVSMERIESLLVERNAQLWIQHAPESGIQAPAVVR